MSARAGRIGLVPARYGDRIVGGAEIVLRQMAFGLQARGWDVEILTTTALDHHSWANELEPGLHVEDGMPVRRFPVVDTTTPERGELERRILAGDTLTITEQQRWMNGGMRVPELYHHILDHADDYRALVFTPYPFWVTFACSQIAPEKSVLWTCLHDEPYAYLDLFRPVFTGSAGLLFQSGPEQDLALRIAPDVAPHEVVGCGVEVPERYDPDGFRERYGIEGRFLLYAGRREGAKGWDELLEALAAINARRDLPFTLVTMGAGEVRPPRGMEGKVVDVGFLDDDERDNAFAAADAYLQPSRYEAFSRTIMEAWLAGTPVIANGGSEVVRWHCERSGAGLTYDDELELEQCLHFLADAPQEAAAMAASGRGYVLENYTWELVLDRVEAQLEAWTEAP
ncbi:glycosyltransferase family 4 protein [Cellulomonas fimi]|uniref:glycosyltransferase family 4 protein n=1 Tax=Cellulomonas fimi TaxID=1708 RepID=UPI00234DD825|nr:glycosyltransferase family 4 protein [Cellulomonas fimi]MDC7122972.1 glycosyltransferase family 4 protein [Cellulomonas fimi]